MIPADFRPRRIVVLRPRGLGDVVLSTAVLAALKAHYPEAVIDYVSERASRDLLEGDPRLRRLFLLGAPRQVDSSVSVGGMLDAVRWMRSEPADLVVDLFSNPRTALLTMLSGARYRVGLDKRMRRLAYNVRIRRFQGSPQTDHRYAKEVQLDFLRGAGIPADSSTPAGISPSSADETFAARAMSELGYDLGAPFGALLPGGSWESKRWSVEGFVAAGRAMAEHYGCPTLVLWGPPEQEDAEKIARDLGEQGRLAPPSRLREMAALLSRPALLVTTDCLGRHFAVTSDVPTVGLFGSTDPRDWTPSEGPHATIEASEHGFVRLADLPPAPVVEVIERVLREGWTRPGAPR